MTSALNSQEYRSLQTICVRISDEKTVEGIRKLIAEMEAQKAALHAVGR